MESLPRLILSLVTWIGCADSHASNRQVVFGVGDTRACFSNEGGAISYDRTLILQLRLVVPDL